VALAARGSGGAGPQVQGPTNGGDLCEEVRPREEARGVNG
jgi:hypothetical protein